MDKNSVYLYVRVSIYTSLQTMCVCESEYRYFLSSCLCKCLTLPTPM